MRNDPEEFIRQVVRASALRPLVVFSAWQTDDGWWQAFTEPVLYIALVERRWPDGTTETDLQPVVHDVNTSSGLDTFAHLREESHQSTNPDVVEVLPADSDWEVVMRAVQRGADFWASIQAIRAKRASAGR
jgi:hypothetical protein